MNFIVEKNIPFVSGLLEPFGSVAYLAPESITPEAVRNADALLVRTRTRCDASLLQGSSVRFIGTCTIGTDHINLPWCAENGITVANAPGCNAPAVAQYVLASIARLVNRPLHQHTLAIVGVGHVGSIIQRWAEALDMRVLLCDPPRQRAEGGSRWSSLQQIAREADIITFHTPLTRDGQDATFHMADSAFFSSLRRAPIIINAARGPVVSTPDLIHALRHGLVSKAVIDTWENEPHISTELLALAHIATPHIAGYSREGKIRATRMVLDSLSQALSLPHITMKEPLPPRIPAEVTVPALLKSYNPFADTQALRQAFSTAQGSLLFESLRNSYALRAETPASRIS